MEELITLCDETVGNVMKLENQVNLEFRLFKAKIEEICLKHDKDNAPTKSKSRVKRLGTIMDEEGVDASDENSVRDSISSTTSSTASNAGSPTPIANIRPVRTARSKVVYTEPSIRDKLRQPVNIKQERTSKVSGLPRGSVVNDENNKNMANENCTVDNGSVNKETDIAEKDNQNNMNSSIEIIAPEEVKLEILSDDDTERMPPPKLPGIKLPRKPRTKKAAPAVSTGDVEIKRSSKRSTTPVSESRKHSKAQITASNIDFESVVVKTEKISLCKEDAIPNDITKSGAAKIKNKNKKATKASRANEESLSPSKSEKSIYEDAVTEEKQAEEETHSNANEVINETFNTPADSTFTTQPANSTFTAPLTNSTFILQNETFNCVKDAKTSDKSKNDENYHESIMTEDDSIDGNVQSQDKTTTSLKSTVPVTATLVPSKKKKEIFNPYVSSPVMKKVEAFEKHAVHAVASPANMRARTRAALGVTPSHVPRALLKSATPNAKQIGTPLQNNLTKTHSSSTSKLTQLNKKQTSTTDLRRELSLDDLTALKKSNNLALLDEKRKKREEKQRIAQQQREQIDREKREQAEKASREREEKYRKKMQEKEDKLRLEREEKLRLENARKEALKLKKEAEQRRLLEEHSRNEAERVARENAEIMRMNLAKENQQHKLQMQMHQQRLLLQQQQQMQQTKFKQPVTLYNFDLLETDDSTDDESKPSSKRPPVPSWSKKNERYEKIIAQSKINAKIVDAFFSVEPMTPDLAEIFPKIDKRKLQRNSSAIWRTPPRYSEIPIYK